jgi:Helix-turn-helix domain
MLLRSGVFEIALKHRGNAYRVIYAVQIGAAIWVIFRRNRRGGPTMSDDDMELVHGSGNVFRDFGDPNAEVLQLKAILAAKIIDVLDAEKISVRRAHELRA